MIKRILVTGANGQLGQEFQAIAKDYTGFDFIFTSREELDITNETVAAFFQETKPDYCINCAAYTAVDKAEEEREYAYKINRKGVENLAEASKLVGIPFIHISSDYVYHNEINRPLKEEDPTTPKGIYAQSKLAGENAAINIYPENTLILRTSWVYSSFGHNFVKTMLRLGKERSSLGIVADQIGAPTYARDLAEAILKIIDQFPPESLSGIYNYANAGVCSWYDFALAIFEIEKIECSVTPIPSSSYPTPAQRPHYSVLDTRLWRAKFSMEIPHWRQSLATCLSLM